MPPEAFWHDNMVTSEAKLAKNPQFWQSFVHGADKRLQSLKVIQLNLDYPDIDYPDSFSGPVFFHEY